MTMSSSDGMTPGHGTALDILLQQNPNWPFGPAMQRLRQRYMPKTNEGSGDASPSVQPDETPSEPIKRIIAHHHTASHEPRGHPLPLSASLSNSETSKSAVGEPSPPRLGKRDHGLRIPPGIDNPPHHGLYSQPDSAASPPTLGTLDHDPRCLAAIANLPDQRPYSQPNNATSPPALGNRHGRESSPGIDHPHDENIDKQRRPDSLRSRLCPMSLANNFEESQHQLITQADRRALIQSGCDDELTVNGASTEVRKNSLNKSERPPITIPWKSIAREKDPSVTHPLAESAPPSTVKNDTSQNVGYPAERKSVRFELSSSAAKRGSEQPAYPSKRPRMSSPAELVPGSQDASPSNRESGSPSQRRELCSNHASTSAIVSGFTAHVNSLAQTSAAGASAPPKSQYGSLGVPDTRLRLATMTFSYPRNLQEMVLIFCQIGLAHQRLNEWQPNNWPAIGVEEMNRWKHSLEEMKKLSDMGFLKDYFQAVKDLGCSPAFQYIPETSGGPGAILLKDCTPLGLVYRPLIKTLRRLGTKRQLSPTMSDLSNAIKAHLTKTPPAKLVAGATSLQTYIEAAERDGIVFVARLSKPNSTELSVRVELTRPWKASQRYSKSFPIEDAEVDLMKFPGPHRTAIEAYQRVVSATRCALCGDMGHYSIECPVPMKSMSDASKAIELPDGG